MKKALLLVLLFAYYTPIFGQLGFCTGSKGAPILNENFGNGAGYGPQLPVGTTTYTYIGGFPIDGKYTIYSNANLTSSWHLSLDHTPDNQPNGFNGKMLIVNANLTAGEFYKRTVTGLCVNTTFEFSAWLMNVYKSTSNACLLAPEVPVNVRFEIWDATETTLLQSGNTNNIYGTSTPIWTQYGLVFTTGPAQTSVVLKMKNNGAGGCGNDLAIDDIVFRSCGASTAVTIAPSAASSYYACQNELPFNLSLQATTSATTAQAYQWQQSSDNITWTSITGQNGATYNNSAINTMTYYRVKVAQDIANLNNDYCSTISDIFTFGVYPAVPVPVSSGNQTLCEITSGTQLFVTAPANTTINWYDAPTGGNLLLVNSENFNPSAAGIYYAEAISNSTGCASIRVPVELIINPTPVVSITGATATCTTSTVLTAVPSTPGTYSYAWTVPTGVTNPGDVASFSTTTAGNYSVIITNTVTTCVSASASGTVTFIPIPTVSVNSDSICSSSSTTISATPGTIGTYSYAWTVPTGVINPGNVSSFTANTAGTYSVIITDVTSTCSSNSASGIITVNPSPVVSVSSTAICAGNTTTLTATPSTTGTYTYSWTVPTGAIDPGNLPAITSGIVGTYSVVITDTVSLCSSASASGSITANPLPLVTVNSQTFCAGSSALVVATPSIASTYSYAWTVPTGVTNPGDVASFTTSVAGNYSVIITNTVTTCVSASASGTVTLNPIPTVSVNSDSICLGSSTTISATPGTTGTYSYAWTVPTGVTNPGNVSSFTANTAGTYSVILTDASTTCSSNSASGIITVNPSPVVSVSSTAICAGNTTTLTATPSTTGTYTYSWTVPTGAIDPGNVPAITSGIVGTYSVVITDTVSLCSSASASGSITVNPLPLVTVNSQTFCAGSSALVVATPSISSTYSYAWTVPTGVTNPGDVSSFSTTVAGNYSVIITNTVTTCVSVSASGSFTINPTSFITGNTTICQGLTTLLTGSSTSSTTMPWTSSNIAVATIDGTGLVTGITAGTTTITFTNINGCTASTIVEIKAIPSVGVNSTVACLGATVTVTATPNSSGIFTYTWTVPTSVSPPGDVANFTTSVEGTYSVIITDTATNCSSTSASGTISLNAIPTVVATPNVQAICSGQAIGVVFSSNLAGTTFSWTVNQIDATGATPSSGSILSEILTATGSIPGTVTYTIIPSSNGCLGIPTDLVVTVTPKPTVIATPSSETICSGNSTNIQLTSNLINTTYSWNAVQISSTGALASNGNSINQILTTIGNAAGQAAYSVTPISNGCPGNPIVVDVFVNPIPIGNASPPTQIICSGQTTSISLSSNVAGTQYNWTTSANGATGDFASSGNNIAQTLTTLFLNQGTVAYTILPSANGCTGTPLQVTVGINPIPEAFGSATDIICSGQSTSISLSANMMNTSFSWTVTQNGVTGASAGTTTTISQTLNAINGVGTAIYEITPFLDGCFGLPITSTITVNPLPKPTLVGGVICVDQTSLIAFQTYTLDSGLNATDYSFVWTLDGTVLTTSVSNTHSATIVGVYGVTATNIATGCVSNEVLTGVTSTFPGLTVTTEQTFYFANNATVSVTVSGGTGTYLYQLDNGIPQTSPTFSGLTFGNHTLYVTDTDGCTSLSTSILIVDYPHFFTPNGDGINDTWFINAINSDAKIFIFDRTGRLLKQIGPEGLGWDGTFVGNKLPADDYWFTIEYSELGVTKIFKSHFALKR